MENQTTTFEPLFEKAENYGKTSLKLLKLKTIEKSTRFISIFITHIILMLFFVIFLLFLSLGLAILISDLLGMNYLGYFIVSGIYGAIGLIIYLFLQVKIKKYITNSVVTNLLKE